MDNTLPELTPEEVQQCADACLAEMLAERGIAHLTSDAGFKSQVCARVIRVVSAV